MREFFVVANSFSAPFISDQSTGYAKGKTPEEAMEAFALAYKHPCRLYAAVMYESADAYHKGERAILRWLCNFALAMETATKDLSCYSSRSESPRGFYINDKWFAVTDPYEGQTVAA